MNRPRTLGLVATSAVAALALAACGGSTGGGTNNGGNGKTAAASFNQALTSVVNPSSHKGGTITFDNSSAPDSTDPGNTYYANMWNFTRLYATPLMTYKSCPGKTCGLQLVPGLATAPGQVSKDGLTWTYHIKSGLKFSDGEPITSADIKYAVERTFARDVLPLGPSYFVSLLAPQKPAYLGPYKDKTPGKMGLKAVQTPNATTVVFHLAAPFADFNYVVAIPQTAPVPPKVDLGPNGGAKYQTNPISSGPYMFAPGGYIPNKQFTLVDNPNWVPSMDTEARQLASKIVVNLNVNADKIDSDLLAGNIQMDMAGTGVQTAARAQILSSPSLKAQADNPINGFLWFAYINSKVAPLNNVNCRKAVEFAANKVTLQDAFGGPYAGGDIASTSMPPNILGYQSFDLYNALTKKNGDVASAKAALKACGHPSGFTTNIAFRNDRPKEQAAATALQAALAQVGIKATLKGFPSSNYYGNFAGNTAYVHSHDLGIDFGGWGADFPSPYGWFYYLVDGNAISPAGNTNIGELNDPVVNKLLSQSEAPGTTTAQSASISHQIDMQVMKDAVMLPEVYGKSLLYRSPALTNVYVQAYYGMYNYAVLGTTGK
ncbi:MAG TPA: ABC transporter substrate-binding protein [Streptosporangiaceae bacterium]